MPRPIWSGAITFGLVTIPVALYTATEDHTIHFNQFERGTADRIRYQRVNERTGKEVDYADSYALLVAAMARTNQAGVATFVMRGKEYLTTVRADDDVLALDTLYFADEIRDPHQLDTLPGRKKARGKQLDMAISLIEAMSGPWRPEDYEDTYTAKVHKLIDDKRADKKIISEAEPPEPTGVVDLMEALRRSVEGARKSRGDTRIDDASKSELDELARELKIKDRSKMNRAQLLRSVKNQQRKAS